MPNYDKRVLNWTVKLKEYIAFVSYAFSYMWYVLNELLNTLGKAAVVLFIVVLTMCVSLWTFYYLDVKVIHLPFSIL